MTYSEKLQHPKWQKRRLEILNRDNWTCRICQSKDDQLHAHHGYYEKGLDPWDYPDESLWTLCDKCHSQAHLFIFDINKMIGLTPPEFLPHLVEIIHKELEGFLNSDIKFRDYE